MVPSVAMKGGILPQETSAPLTLPIMQPISKAARMPMIKAGSPVMPAAVSSPVGYSLMNTISTAPTAGNVEPTARSMPPEMMTNVMPRATMPTPALLRSRLIQFLLQLANQAPKLG